MDVLAEEGQAPAAPRLGPGPMVCFKFPDVGQQRLERELVSEARGKSENFLRILAGLEAIPASTSHTKCWVNDRSSRSSSGLTDA